MKIISTLMKKVILGVITCSIFFATSVDAQTRTRDLFMKKDSSQKEEFRKRFLEKQQKELEENRSVSSTTKIQDFRRSGNQIIKPTKGYELSYFIFGNEYYSHSFTYERDSFGRITIEDTKDTVNTDWYWNSKRIISKYNSNGKLVSKTDYVFTGSGYEPSHKDSYSFHSIYTNFETYNGYFDYDEITKTWKLISGRRTTLTISAGKITVKKREIFDYYIW